MGNGSYRDSYAAPLVFGVRDGVEAPYDTVPAYLAGSRLPRLGPFWRIELYEMLTGGGPLRLRVVGDAVIGRGRLGHSWPDIDLTWYGAWITGVSRRHALLQPTRSALYIVDLASTNGTYHNGLQLAAGVPVPLMHDDTLNLGDLSFKIRVIEGPDST